MHGMKTRLVSLKQIVRCRVLSQSALRALCFSKNLAKRHRVCAPFFDGKHFSRPFAVPKIDRMRVSYLMRQTRALCRHFLNRLPNALLFNLEAMKTRRGSSFLLTLAWHQKSLCYNLSLLTFARLFIFFFATLRSKLRLLIERNCALALTISVRSVGLLPPARACAMQKKKLSGRRRENARC